MFALAGAVALSAQAAADISPSGESVSAEWLVQQCDPRDNGDGIASVRRMGCLAYLRGYLDGLVNAPRNKGDKGPQVFCGTVDPESLRLSFLRLMNDSGYDRDYHSPPGQPEVRSSAAILLFAALARDYPCKLR
jgi:hypothetical protein